MTEDVPWIPPRLDSLQPRIVRVVIQSVPGHARCIEDRVREVDVGMVYECPVVCFAWDWHATALRKQVPVERPHPLQVFRFFPRIDPTGGACSVENRTAL